VANFQADRKIGGRKHEAQVMRTQLLLYYLSQNLVSEITRANLSYFPNGGNSQATLLADPPYKNDSMIYHELYLKCTPGLLDHITLKLVRNQGYTTGVIIFRDPRFNSPDRYTIYPISLFLSIMRTYKLVIRSDGNWGLEYRIKKYLTEILETSRKLPGIKCRASRNRY